MLRSYPKPTKTKLNAIDLFDKLPTIVDEQGPLQAASLLVDQMRREQRYTELFEALKMMHRVELGLSAVQTDPSEPTSVGSIPPDIQDQLDKKLIAACSEVGTALMRQGKLQEGWMYMRAVGALVEHVHAELLSSLKADILRREKLDETSEVQLAKSIEPLLATRPSLLRDGTYHLDTTHLASTVRFARILDNEEQLRMAVDLAQYGRQLHTQYQYASEEPFAELYPMSLAMFRALLGEHVEAALKMFLQKAESLDPQEHGTVAIENYADLLTRVGRPAEAMQFLIKKMPRGMRPFGIAPSLIELAELSKDYAPMLQQAKERGDLVGFAAALLQSATSTRK